MHPSDNVTLANFLAAPPRGQPAEAAFRCSAGRAYYAAYVHARDALLAASFTVDPSHKGHGQVIAWLKKSTIREIKKIGGQLDDMRRTRNEADYDLGARYGAAFVKLRAQLAVAQASTIIATIDREATKSKRLGIV